jgi:hypothetical protein
MEVVYIRKEKKLIKKSEKEIYMEKMGELLIRLIISK